MGGVRRPRQRLRNITAKWLLMETAHLTINNWKDFNPPNLQISHAFNGPK